MLVHFLFKPINDSLFFATSKIFLQHLSALKIDDHHRDFFNLILINFFQ